jgi:hypothetical protein
MTATLPDTVQRIFQDYLTTEYTTIDSRGQPITWPVTPFYSAGGECIDVTTGIGYPKKANDARANPKVSLLFSDPTGTHHHNPPMVLVQGIARIDEEDMQANRQRYTRESLAKLPGAAESQPPGFMQAWFSWYYTRLYVKVRPERVYVWRNGDWSAEPDLLDSHMEEVRSGHDEEPDIDHPTGLPGKPVWDTRMETLGDAYDTAVLSLVCPDGFPFSIRVPIDIDRSRRRLLLMDTPVGVPLQPGLACVTAHDHDERFTWQRNFQVRGDLVEDDDGWAIVPHKLVGGFELPPGGVIGRMQLNLRKIRRFRKTAKREMKKYPGLRR